MLHLRISSYFLLVAALFGNAGSGGNRSGTGAHSSRPTWLLHRPDAPEPCMASATSRPASRVTNSPN